MDQTIETFMKLLKLEMRLIVYNVDKRERINQRYFLGNYCNLEYSNSREIVIAFKKNIFTFVIYLDYICKIKDLKRLNSAITAVGTYTCICLFTVYNRYVCIR